MINDERSLDKVLKGASKALVIGVGGGGDIVGALAVARYCESFEIGWKLGGVSWERLPIDPHPGPRPLSEIDDIRAIGTGIGLANANTKCDQGVFFAESRMAAFLQGETVLIDVGCGPRLIAAGLEQACELFGTDLVIFVDVGGDVLATGVEAHLGSPLCDAVMLASAAHLPRDIDVLLAVFGPGCDGELTPDELLERVAEATSHGAWLGALGLTPEIRRELETVVEIIPTEASAQALRCARGETGITTIRGGTRTVQLSPLGAITFFLDARTTLDRAAPLAEAVVHSGSLDQANEVLHRLGVQTELDFERQHSLNA